MNELKISQSDKPDIAFESHSNLCKTIEEVQCNFLKLGALLGVIHNECYYITLGYSTFDEYCSTPEIDLSRSQVYKLIQVYSRWVERYGHSPDELKGISIEKLYIASSQCNEDNQEEWLTRAETLSRADLKAETTGGKQHYQMVTCPYCGKDFELKRENIQ